MVFSIIRRKEKKYGKWISNPPQYLLMHMLGVASALQSGLAAPTIYASWMVHSLGLVGGSSVWTEERDLVKKATRRWCGDGGATAKWDQQRGEEGSFLEQKMEMQKQGQVALHAVGMETQNQLRLEWKHKNDIWLALHVDIQKLPCPVT